MKEHPVLSSSAVPAWRLKLKHLSVGKQVLFTVGTLCAILLIIDGMFFYGLRSIERSNQQQSRALSESVLLDETVQEIGLMQAHVLRQLLASDPGEIKRLDQAVRDLEKTNAKRLAEYYQFVDTEMERGLYARVMQARKTYWEMTLPVLELGLANRDAEATELIMLKQAPTYDEYLRSIIVTANQEKTEADETVKTTARFTSQMRIIGNTLAGMAIIMIIGTGFSVAGITRRLKEDNRLLQMEVAERRRAEDELRESERRFSDMLRTLELVAIMLDREGRVTYCNAYLLRLTGWQRAEVIDRSWFETFIPAESVSEVRKTFSALLGEESAAWHHESEIVTRTGNRRFIRWNNSVLRSATGEVIGTTSIGEDITERKLAEGKLVEAQTKLIERSRLAGMAEVATSVLHNVGNVLNSVNVASSCVADNLKKSKAVNLSKVVALLQEHEHDLGAFFTHDPKGRQIPAYLALLAGHLATEQVAALRELEQLQKNIEHIKDIVTMQQGLAKTSGVTESVSMIELAEDALKMNLTGLARNDIEVIKEFNETPPVTVEKHKVLQILVNLVRNAKQSCAALEIPRKLTIRITSGKDYVRLAVCDNGVGIPPENLTRIFSHGFTTKQDGHGFGLHSAALAAKEMGGTLTVQSDGPGQGAVFTLELPCRTQKNLAKAA